jgi:hypothetical protein
MMEIIMDLGFVFFVVGVVLSVLAYERSRTRANTKFLSIGGILGLVLISIGIAIFYLGSLLS